MKRKRDIIGDRILIKTDLGYINVDLMFVLRIQKIAYTLAGLLGVFSVIATTPEQFHNLALWIVEAVAFLIPTVFFGLLYWCTLSILYKAVRDSTIKRRNKR